MTYAEKPLKISKEAQKNFEQNEMCVNKGTEMAFIRKYNNYKKSEIYNCVFCGANLFSSETKFDSGIDG